MQHKLIIPGQLPGLNDYSNAERGHWSKGAVLKKQTEELVGWHILQQLKVRFNRPVRLDYLWIEPNKRRDLDNIAAAQKFVQDALVKHGVLGGDGWAHIKGFTHNFDVDKDNPRIEITIQEE